MRVAELHDAHVVERSAVIERRQRDERVGEGADVLERANNAGRPAGRARVNRVAGSFERRNADGLDLTQWLGAERPRLAAAGQRDDADCEEAWTLHNP